MLLVGAAVDAGVCLYNIDRHVNRMFHARYITDCITKEEAISMLEASLPLRAEREAKIIADGFPAYTTQV